MTAIGHSLPSIAWTSLLMILVYYVFSVVGTMLFAEVFPDWFGSIPKTMYTLFQIMTLEGWSIIGLVLLILNLSGVLSDPEFPTWVFFIPFVVMSAFIVLNIVVGIVVNSISEVTTELDSIRQRKKNEKQQIDTRKKLILKTKEEEKLVKNWKIYLELIGKNGITKMVLRKTLPIINAKLSKLLSDVCDFDIEVAINNKNEVMFHLIKDGVISDLYSGSGFEKTAAALALRSVLADMSTMPRMNGVVWDEIFGRVAKENYDNIKSLCHKIAESYDYVFTISHNDEIKEWCNDTVLVKKENNISRVILG